jgi:hypothetical protein
MCERFVSESWVPKRENRDATNGNLFSLKQAGCLYIRGSLSADASTDRKPRTYKPWSNEPERAFSDALESFARPIESCS